MAGYTRQSAASIANGQIIEDYHFNNEFNQLEAAFSGSTGHAHDGSVGNGPKISLTASVDGVLPVANGGTGVTTLQGLNDALTSGSVFKDNTFIIADFADTTKRFRFEVSAVSSATTRTFTLPDTDITISSYMGGLLNTANKADLQDALDIKTGGLPISTINGLQSALDSKLNLSGGTMTGRLEIPATSAAGGMFNISPGTEGPSSPIPGDVWISGDTLYFRGTSATRALGSTGALSTVSQSDAEAGTSTTTRAWTAQRVNQAIQALSPVKSVAGKTGAVTLSNSDITGLGDSATRNVGTTSGTVAAGDDSRITGALQSSGGTMTGALTLSGNPTNALHAATKQYVDGLISGFRNKIINGDFDIWQRGPGPFAGTVYTADRWYPVANGNTVSTSRQSFSPGQTQVPGNPKYFLRFSRTTTGSNDSFMNQRIEDVRTLAGRLVTYTFWAKANKALSVNVGYFQSFGSGGSANVEAYPEVINVGTTWAKYSVTMTWPSVSGKTIGDGSYVAFRLVFSAANGNFTFDLAHVSVVEGDATAEDDPFSPRHIQQELALCQRYYLRLGGTENYERFAVGYCHTSTSARTVVFFPTEMRAPPSLTYNGALNIENPSGNTAVTSLSANEPSKLTCGVNAAVSSGLTAGHGCHLTAHNDFNAYIEFDAEL